VKRLVYCSYCGEEHAVSEGDEECAPGAWDEVVTVPVDGMYEVELGPGDSNGSPKLRQRRGARLGRALLRLLRWAA
jgi:hypothetical protein